MKFEVVKNTVAATAFASENHIQVTINAIAKTNPEVKKFSFRVPPQNSTMKIVYVYSKDGVFEGYVRVDRVHNVPKNKIVDGKCSSVNEVSDCKELIVTNYNG